MTAGSSNASYDAAEEFGLRAVRGETAGYAHSTEICEAALQRAAETARSPSAPAAAPWPPRQNPPTSASTPTATRSTTPSSR